MARGTEISDGVREWMLKLAQEAEERASERLGDDAQAWRKAYGDLYVAMLVLAWRVF